MIETTCLDCGSNGHKTVLDVSDRKDTYLDYLKIPYDGIRRQYVACDSCGLIYRRPILDETEKKLLYEHFRDYDLRQEDKHEYFKRIVSLPREDSENMEKCEYLKGRIPANGAILDVGCGAGVFLYMFAECFPGWKMTGIEPTKDFSDVARTYGIHIMNEYLTEDTMDEVFDLIVLNHVLEHLDKPSLFVELLKKYLKPDGLLYIEVPSAKDIGYLDRGHDRFMCQHDVIHSPETLSRIIRQGGLNILDCQEFTSKRKRNNLRVLTGR